MKLAFVVSAVLGMVFTQAATAGTPQASDAPDYKLNPAVVSALKGSDKVGVNLSVGFDANRPTYVPKDFTSQPYGAPVVKSSMGR